MIDPDKTLMFCFFVLVQAYLFQLPGVKANLRKITNTSAFNNVGLLLYIYFVPVFCIIELSRIATFENFKILAILGFFTLLAIIIRIALSKLGSYIFNFDLKTDDAFTIVVALPNLSTLAILLGEVLCFYGSPLHGDPQCSNILGIMTINYFIFCFVLFTIGIFMMSKSYNKFSTIKEKLKYVWYRILTELNDEDLIAKVLIFKHIKDSKSADKVFNEFKNHYRLKCDRNFNFKFEYNSENDNHVNNYNLIKDKSNTNRPIINNTETKSTFTEEKNNLSPNKAKLKRYNTNFKLNEIKALRRNFNNLEKKDTFKLLIPENNNKEIETEKINSKPFNLNLININHNIQDEYFNIESDKGDKNIITEENEAKIEIFVKPTLKTKEENNDKMIFLSVKENTEKNLMNADKILTRYKTIKKVECKKKRSKSYSEINVLKRQDFYKNLSAYDQLNNAFFKDKNEIISYYTALYDIILESLNNDFEFQLQKNSNNKIKDLETEKKILFKKIMNTGNFPVFQAVNSLKLGRKEFIIFEQIWREFEEKMNLLNIKVDLNMKLIDNKTIRKNIIINVFNAPIISCIVGLFFGLSGLREVFFSDNHYIKNINRISGMTIVPLVSLVLLGTGNSIMHVPKFTPSLGVTKFQLIYSLICSFIIFPFVGFGLIKFWEVVYGGLIITSKVFRFSMFLPMAVPITPLLYIVIDKVNNYFKEEYNYILYYQSISILLTNTLVFFIYFISIE